MIPTERYTLILKHEYIDEEGNKHELDEPVIVTHIMYVPQFGYVSAVINDMIEQMRHYVLQMIKG